LTAVREKSVGTMIVFIIQKLSGGK